MEKVLKPLFEEKLDELGIGYKPRIFVDTQSIESGDWPIRLSEAHARSRIIVPVLCAPYFQSGWCTSEWSTAFARETLERQRSGNSTLDLVLPLHFNDLNEKDIARLSNPSIRDQVRARKPFDVREFTCLANPHGDNESAYRFRQQIEKFCADVLLQAIENAPPWQQDWPRLPTKAILGSDPSWATEM